MKVTHWVDNAGYQRVSIVRNDDDTLEATHGLQKGPPDITLIDWENVVRDLHNGLVERKLFSYQDMVQSKDGVTSAILSALRRKVITLYKQQR